jgi:predicted O-methyltransferase YrrM
MKLMLLLEKFKAPFHVHRLRSRLPLFCEWASEKAAQMQRLQSSYEEYVTGVSSARSAVSLETAALLSLLCDATQPTRVLDVGSGFSSLVLRQYQKNSRKKVEVISLDNDLLWLEKTRSFLMKNGFTGGTLFSFEDFMAGSPGKFDLILYDLGDLDQRKINLRRVAKLSLPSGWMVLDDLHKKHYRKFVEQELSSFPHTFISLYALTKDKFSRYAGVITDIHA